MISTKTTGAGQAIHLTVEPRKGLVDEPVNIKVTGCIPGQRVVIQAYAYDDWQEEWTSSATFVADTAGEISCSTQKPRVGSYRGVDPGGLFWSLHPVRKKHKVPLMINTHEPIVISLSARVGKQVVASTTIERLFGHANVVCHSIREDGLVGALYAPADAGPYPGVLLLSGSDAAICENQAALLASHGYAAFTLAYFGHEHLPGNLVDIPLEYFDHAIQWLQDQELVDKTKLAVIGFSRGAELALLLATLHPTLSVVIAGSPSAHLHIGLAQNDYSRAAWTRHNRPLPHLRPRMDLFSILALAWSSIRYRAMALRPIFLATLDDDEENLAAAAIPVEKIQGAVLLISGQDDQLWPSSLFARLLMRRFATHHHAYPYKHLNYPKAGHFVCFPYGYPNLPPLAGAQRGLACGGRVPANAWAVSDSWRAMLAFLRDNLAHPLPVPSQQQEAHQAPDHTHSPAERIFRGETC